MFEEPRVLTRLQSLDEELRQVTPFRELLTGAGVKSARITGSGVFKDGASDTTIRDYAFNGTIRDWQVIVPDFGTIEGAFQITALEFNGRPTAIPNSTLPDGSAQFLINAHGRAVPTKPAANGD